MFRFHAAAVQDLIILGGGAGTVCALAALIKQVKKEFPNGVQPPLTITILERTGSAGNGFPYDPQLHHPILRVNNPNSGMIIDLENPRDFANWLQANGERLKHEYPMIAHIIDDNNSGKDLYAPRMLFGKYLQERLPELIIDAKQTGIHIEVQTNVNVVDAIQDAEQRWYLKTEQHGTFTANHLLIAAGHLPSKKFSALESRPGYFNTPYTDLSAIADAPVFILGSGLSAIDAAKILAYKKHRAPIYMISPSGQLPRVKGPLGTTHYQMQFLTKDNLDKKNIRLSTVMSLFADEVKCAMNNSAWTLKAVMRMARQENINPARTLKREMNWVENNKVRGWQLMLARIWFEPLPLVWKNLHDDDRQEFLSQYFSLFLKWGAGMPVCNAKEMLELAEKGQLHFISSKKDVTFNEDKNQFELTTADGKTLSAATVINASGHGYDISGNPSLHAMAKRGLVRQEKFRGGIDIDRAAHIVDANGKAHENAFALGMITLGSHLDASSIEMAAHAAKKIAPLLAKKLLQSQSTFTLANYS